MSALTIYSDGLKGDLLLESAARMRRLFPEARVSGDEGPEGGVIWLVLPRGTDERAAVADLLQLLRTVPVPRDTSVWDGADEYEVYEDRESLA